MAQKKKTAIGVALLLLLLFAGGAAVYCRYSSRNAPVVVIHRQSRAAGGLSHAAALNWPAEQQGHFAVAVTRDRQGRIWIGTEDRGLSLSQAGAWKQFTTKDGLGDETVYSLATDLQGRVWVGHCRSGVSVFNGESWRNYDALTGPLGQHVVAIAVCPATASSGAGDVWLASELGLSRYSVATDSWSYFTRADGLPSDQASSLAFDGEGNLYVGTECDGIAMARAAEGYRNWQNVRGPMEPPPESHGAGLPSNNINAMLVARDGTILAGTNHGLARSADRGVTWTFMRGRDWIAKVKKSIDGAPTNWNPTNDAILAEDYIMSLAQDGAGRLWVGYRIKGCQCLSPDGEKVLYADNPKRGQYCQWILPMPGQPPLTGSYGNGVAELKGPADESAPTPLAEAPPPASFPSPAAAPTEGDLVLLTQRVNAASNSTEVVAFLGQDWTTQGDWVGRYGRQKYLLPPSVTNNGNDEYACHGPVAGLRGKPPDGFYYYPDKQPPQNQSMLYLPWNDHRMEFEWNDGGWQQKIFNSDFEGPDLWLDVTVPAGVSRVTLYHYIPGDFNGANRRRDFTIRLLKYQEDIDAAEHAPPLADSRVMPAQGGAYRTFLVSQGHYWLHIISNYSYGATLQGVFMDRADASFPASYDTVAETLNGMHYDPPQTGISLPGESSRLRAARALWAALDSRYASAVNMQLPCRILAYRAAIADRASADLLADGRWHLHLWTPADVADWDRVTAQARKALPATHPSTSEALR